MRGSDGRSWAFERLPRFREGLRVFIFEFGSEELARNPQKPKRKRRISSPRIVVGDQFSAHLVSLLHNFWRSVEGGTAHAIGRVSPILRKEAGKRRRWANQRRPGRGAMLNRFRNVILFLDLINYKERHHDRSRLEEPSSAEVGGVSRLRD